MAGSAPPGGIPAPLPGCLLCPLPRPPFKTPSHPTPQLRRSWQMRTINRTRTLCLTAGCTSSGRHPSTSARVSAVVASSLDPSCEMRASCTVVNLEGSCNRSAPLLNQRSRSANLEERNAGFSTGGWWGKREGKAYRHCSFVVSSCTPSAPPLI